MEVGDATDLIRDTLLLALLISAPMLLIGLVVGLLISLFQAVTQIQEQTLVFVPKITSMMTAAILLMPWVFERLMEYAKAMFSGGMP
jgi:flagellar biosynthetic protein FliQ